MNVLLLNGSPHADGCVHLALSEVAKGLTRSGVGYEEFHIGTKPVQDCIACRRCAELGHCVFRNDRVADFIEAMRGCDALVVGAPVYYAGPPGALCSLLDRAFFSARDVFKGKPAACVVNCRRGGASATFDRLNKFFTIVRMPVISSQYWNSVHGAAAGEAAQDAEGLQTMRVLGRNMAWLLKNMSTARISPPESEPQIRTNFIR